MGLFSRFWNARTKYVPVEGDGRCDGQWVVGDLAVCVQPIMYDLRTGGPTVEKVPNVGDVWRVTGIDFIIGYHSLTFAEGAFNTYYTASSFRKAVLDEHKVCEEDFLKLVKRSRVPEEV